MGFLRRGRPAQPGERYACGKRKPTGEPIAPAAWQRIRTDIARTSNDPRLESEIGRLSFHKELTDAQAATAFRIGEIYRTFERFKGLGRSCRSPNYGSGGDGSIAEELLLPQALENLERKIRSSNEAFGALSAELKLYPVKVREIIEELCVANHHISPMLLDDVRVMLDRLTGFFGATTSKKQQRVELQVPLIAATKPVPALPSPRRVDADKVALLLVLGNTDPNFRVLPPHEKYEFFAAAKARAIFNDGKRQRQRA